MQASNAGNFIWLQLSMSTNADTHLEPLTYFVGA